MPSLVPNRLLVPSDFSTVAGHAKAYAASLAGCFSCELHSLHVQVLPETPHLDREAQEEITRLLAQGDTEIEDALQRDVDKVSPSFQSHLVRALSAAEAISATCAALECDTVVMGTHGRTGLSRFFLGSVAEEVVKTAPAPVVTVRSAVPSEGLRPRHILAPHDFSEHSSAALELAAAWARRLDARLTVLHVVEPVVYPDIYAVDLMPRDLTDQLQQRSTRALATLAENELAGIDTRTVVATGRPADAIIEEADSCGADLVVMGTRGLTAVQELLLGSIAEAAIRRLTVPLMTTRKF